MTEEQMERLAAVGLTAEDAEITPFNIQDYLQTEEDQLCYLQAALEEDDNAFLQTALGDIAKARGMTDIAEITGMSRTSLYKALSENAHPRFSTIRKIIDALGYQITLTHK
ncbi:addiction module antidote protein [Suttonella indologenes]|uniref:Predicted transcriptional regulator n=1 Tax=Suttonella indologenes TaxID=13276 RepID=A0A380N0I2_9GAMM|nr:addiction module antidote protein [Suttonella indologenes]SUO98004.1 Predicted transcriptional regulator [Suttonella indologenes]